MRRWRDGDYANLVAARCDGIVEAKNLLAEGGDVDGGAIEIHDDHGTLVSRIALLDVQAPASSVAVPQPGKEARDARNADLRRAGGQDRQKSARFRQGPEAALCPV